MHVTVFRAGGRAFLPTNFLLSFFENLFHGFGISVEEETSDRRREYAIDRLFANCTSHCRYSFLSQQVKLKHYEFLRTGTLLAFWCLDSWFNEFLLLCY